MPRGERAQWRRLGAVYAVCGPAGRYNFGMADAPGMRAVAPPPKRILVAGDWHGDQAWALNVIKRVPQLLAAERTRLVLQLGDFGIWPGPGGRSNFF